MKDVTAERWLPVPGYEGLYEVSDLGSARSLPHYVRTNGGAMRLSPGRILKFGTYKDGHKHVTFSRDGKTRTFTVHSVVLAAFVGPRPGGMQVRHFPDRDPANNRLDNLVYGTAKENAEDRDDWHGTNHELNLTHCPQDHPYDEANTYWYKGTRQCRTCRNGGRVGPECSKDRCDRSARTRGLCQKHYIEWLRSQMSDEQRTAARAKDAERARQKRARSATLPG